MPTAWRSESISRSHVSNRFELGLLGDASARPRAAARCDARGTSGPPCPQHPLARSHPQTARAPAPSDSRGRAGDQASGATRRSPSRTSAGADSGGLCGAVEGSPRVAPCRLTPARQPGLRPACRTRSRHRAKDQAEGDLRYPGPRLQYGGGSGAQDLVIETTSAISPAMQILARSFRLRSMKRTRRPAC